MIASAARHVQPPDRAETLRLDAYANAVYEPRS
jgi:hypothetical protein